VVYGKGINGYIGDYNKFDLTGSGMMIFEGEIR
jgi:hypothetical protein